MTHPLANYGPPYKRHRWLLVLLSCLSLIGVDVAASTLRFNSSDAALYVRESDDVPEQLLGTFRFMARRAGAGDVVQLSRAETIDAGSCRLIGAEDLGSVMLRAETSSGGLRLSVDLSLLNRRGGLFRPVIELAGGEGGGFFAVDGGTKRHGSRAVSRADLGTFVLEVEFDPHDVARTLVAPGAHTIIAWRWHSKVVESLPAAPFVLDFRTQDRPLSQIAEVLGGRLQGRLMELDARLAAWHSLLPRAGAAATESLGIKRNELADAVTDLPAGARTVLRGIKEEFRHLEGRMAETEGEFAALMNEWQPTLQATAQAKLAAMPFRVGLAYDGDPEKLLEEWALFRMGLFRLAVNPVWHGGKDRGQRTAIVQQALREAEAYGMRAVLSVYEEKNAQVASDLTFTNEFVPALRSGFHEFGFNSAPMRDRNLADFDYWLGATRDCRNIESYKIDNEPFWSTQAYPVFGYDQATVGCSAETFIQAVQTRFPTFADWRNQLAGTVGETVLHWQRWDDMRLPPGEARGLTFVDYLRREYGTIERLNAAWGKTYREWTEIFPPLPTPSKGRLADDSGAPEFDLDGYRALTSDRPRPEKSDLIAWRDWLRFWPNNTNDELREFVKLARDRGVRVPVGTNCVGGATLNNAGDLVVANAMLPWITPDGLGMVAIDFYQPGYLQGYVRAIVGAAQGRPAEIHETGGSDSKDEAWFMSAYAFAYGARGVLFWRRDHRMPATSALGVAEAIDLLQYPDLVRRSRPVSDGVVIVYPLETLYGEEARVGTAAITLGNVQGALLAAKRQQLQYDFIADRDIGSVGAGAAIKCVVFPAGSWLAEQHLATMEKFIRQGGSAILPADFALRDERGTERSAARLALFRNNPKVLILPENAFFDLRKSVHAPERSMQFGLAGPESALEERIREFLDRNAPAVIRLRDPKGKMLRTNLALTKSPSATYVFIDPWTKAGFVHIKGAIASAQDLRTGRDLAVRRKDHETLVAIPGGATILRLVSGAN
jgi:hypothetical protein